jgi:hypothetical protein
MLKSKAAEAKAAEAKAELLIIETANDFAAPSNLRAKNSFQ